MRISDPAIGLTRVNQQLDQLLRLANQVAEMQQTINRLLEVLKQNGIVLS